MPRRKHLPAIHPFDGAHGTDTSGLIPGSALAAGTDARLGDLTAYYGIAPSILQNVLDLWLQRTNPHPIERTVFLDVGAGKGRAVLLASEYPFLRVEGIELHAGLAAIAEANVALWQKDPGANPLSPIAVHHADATCHPLPAEAILTFLFHPFELPVLRRFLRHVEASLTLHPRPFDLIYVNAEHDSYLDRHPAWHRLWTGLVPMSPEDHTADLEAIAEQKEYGSTGNELCSIYRFERRGSR